MLEQGEARRNSGEGS